MKPAKLLLICLTLLLPVAFAQVSKSVMVSATGTVYGEPDEASFDAGINVLNADAQAATTKVSERTSSLTQALKAAGVAEQDIRTGNFSVYPEPIYRKNQLVATRYRVISTLSVTVRDTAQLGELLAKSAEVGANEISNVVYDFSASARMELERQAREQAMTSAREKVQQLASLGGAELGAVQRIVENQLPGDVYAGRYDTAFAQGGMMSGGGSVPVSSGQLSVEVSVQVTFALK